MQAFAQAKLDEMWDAVHPEAAGEDRGKAHPPHADHLPACSALPWALLMISGRTWKPWEKKLLLVSLSLYSSVVVAPIRYMGLTDDAIIASASLFVRLPMLAYLAYALVFSIWNALSPAANDILNLAIRLL